MTAEEYYQSRNGGKDSKSSEEHGENLTPSAWVQMMQDYGDISAKSWKEAHDILAEHYRHSAELNVKEMNDNHKLRTLLDNHLPIASNPQCLGEYDLENFNNKLKRDFE
jgi:hypothetical protein